MICNFVYFVPHFLNAFCSGILALFKVHIITVTNCLSFPSFKLESKEAATLALFVYVWRRPTMSRKIPTSSSLHSLSSSSSTLVLTSSSFQYAMTLFDLLSFPSFPSAIAVKLDLTSYRLMSRRTNLPTHDAFIHPNLCTPSTNRPLSARAVL